MCVVFFDLWGGDGTPCPFGICDITILVGVCSSSMFAVDVDSRRRRRCVVVVVYIQCSQRANRESDLTVEPSLKPVSLSLLLGTEDAWWSVRRVHPRDKEPVSVQAQDKVRLCT